LNLLAAQQQRHYSRHEKSHNSRAGEAAQATNQRLNTREATLRSIQSKSPRISAQSRAEQQDGHRENGENPRETVPRDSGLEPVGSWPGSHLCRRRSPGSSPWGPDLGGASTPQRGTKLTSERLPRDGCRRHDRFPVRQHLQAFFGGSCACLGGRGGDGSERRH
jgi:hypothetical protein